MKSPPPQLLATVFVAEKPIDSWRRDPESNRTNRICNPKSAVGTYSTPHANQRLRTRMGRMGCSVCVQLAEKSPPTTHYFEGMSMDFRGTVKDEAARKFAGFTYRQPIIRNVDIWSLDPERIHPAHEYPRSVNPPSQPPTPYVELADYEVRIGAMGSDGMNPAQVWMLPNEYTAAKKPMQVCEFRIANAVTLRHEYVNEALKRTFQAPQPTGRKD